MKSRSLFLLLAAVLLAGCVCLGQQRDAPYDTVAPIRTNYFTDQVYVGFDHVRTDYALVTADGNEVATTNGVNVEVDMRHREHITPISRPFAMAKGARSVRACSPARLGPATCFTLGALSRSRL